jgi:hypothetical protein
MEDLAGGRDFAHLPGSPRNGGLKVGNLVPRDGLRPKTLEMNERNAVAGSLNGGSDLPRSPSAFVEECDKNNFHKRCSHGVAADDVAADVRRRTFPPAM